MKRFLVLLISFFVFLPAFAGDITILHTSDVHGRIEPIQYHGKTNVGGAARHSHLFKKTRKDCPTTLVLDSGDYFQGSLYYQIFNGMLSADLLKTLKYDAIALGNHEFDRGFLELKRLIKQSKTTFLSANLEFSDPEMKKLVKPFIVKDINGAKILIIGVTTPNLKNLSNSGGIIIYDPCSIIRKIIAENKADSIIILSHCGYEIDKQIARENPSINLILGGHNHLFFERPILVNNVQIVNSGEFGVYVSKMKFSTSCGIKHFENILMDSSISSDKKILRKLKRINHKVAKIKNTVLAKTELKLIGEQTEIEHCQTNLGRLVLKSMCYENPYDIVLLNTGSIRINRDFTGNITLADAMELLPFENAIVSGKLQGKHLKEALQIGKIYGRGYLQFYSKIKDIEDEQFYTVITSAYVAAGKDGFKPFENMKDITVLYESQKDSFKDFLLKNPEIVDETLIMP